MSVESFRKLSEYNRWANLKLFVFLEKLGEPRWRQPRDTFAGSISGVLHHTLISDSLTMATLTGDEKGFVLRNRLGEEIRIETMAQCLYAKFSELDTARRHLDQQIVEYLTIVTEPELKERLSFFDFDGERRKQLRWHLLTELFTHQVHHRAQLSTILHAMGTPLGCIDFSVFLRAEVSV